MIYLENRYKMGKKVLYYTLLFIFVFGFFSSCGIKTNEEIMQALRLIAKNCEMGSKEFPEKYFGWKLANCKDGVDAKAQEKITKLGLENAFPTLVAAFADKDRKISAAAVYFFNWNFGSYSVLDRFYSDSSLIDAHALDVFIESFASRKEEDYVQYAAKPLAHLAAIKQVESDVWEIYFSAKDTARFKIPVVTGIMRYSSLRSFDQIQTLALNKDRRIASPALRAPMSIKDLSQKKDVLAKVCPWWEKFLEAANDHLVLAAGTGIFSFCPSDSVENALLQIEKRSQKSGRSARLLASALDQIQCPSARFSDDQCKKAQKIISRKSN